MNRRRLLSVLGVGVLAKPSDNRAAEPAAVAAVAVRIVPTSYREKGGGVIDLRGPSAHFHVVVTNVSGEPIRLWKEWCSWGYFDLSFQVTDEAGFSVKVEKNNRAWTKNFPDTEIIPPGGHHLQEVTFDPTDWAGLPPPEANRRKAVRMKAIYDIRPDGETKEHGVWTGQVSSPEESYELWR
jgi:hypothetical protein